MAKILLTDDEPNIVKVVAMRLKANGFEVMTAYDGEEALRLVGEEIPDLILLDLMLPKLNGFEVCQQLKGDDKYKNIPVILFSAKAQREDRAAGKDVGADAYITKPFQPEELLAKIRELLPS